MKLLKYVISIVLALTVFAFPMLCSADETVKYTVVLSGAIDGRLPAGTTFDFAIKCYSMDETDDEKETVLNDTKTLDSSKAASLRYELDKEKVETGGFVYEFRLTATSSKLAVADDKVFAVYLFGRENGVKTFDSSVVDGDDAEKIYDDISNGLTVNAAFNCKTAAPVKIELLTKELSKVYDGIDIADISVNDYKLTGVAEGHQVSLQIGSAKFNSADVKKASKVVLSGLSLTGADADKYKLTVDKLEVGGKITPRPITVTAEDKVMTEGSIEPELTYTLSEQLIQGNEFVGSLARTAGSGAGEYTITRGTLSLTDNYDVKFVEGKLTISSFSNSSVIDAETRITVSGFFAHDSSVKVSELSVADNTYKVLASGASWGKVIKGYNIALNTAAHDGAFTITIPVSGEYEGKELSVYQLLASGGIACYKSTVTNGEITLATDECTSFLLVTEKDAPVKKKVSVGMMVLKVFLIILAVVAAVALLAVLFFFGMVFFNKTDELKKIIKFLKRVFKKK